VRALLHRLNPVLRCWTNYFRYGVSKHGVWKGELRSQQGDIEREASTLAPQHDAHRPSSPSKRRVGSVNPPMEP